MALFISNGDVQEALKDHYLDAGAVIAELEASRRDRAARKATYAPRRGVGQDIDPQYRHPEFNDEHFSVGYMGGIIQRTGYYALRLKLDVHYQGTDPINGNPTHEKYCVEPGKFCGLILLVNANTAEPLAIMNDGVVQHLRVAGGNAIATRHMARKYARVLGILGSGGMASASPRS